MTNYDQHVAAQIATAIDEDGVPSIEEAQEADSEHPEHIAAQELMDAVHSKDASAVRQAMRACYELMRDGG